MAIPTFDVWAAASDEVGKSTLLGTWAGGPVGQRGSTFGVSVLHRMMGGGDVLVQTFGPDFYAGGTDRILTSGDGLPLLTPSILPSARRSGDYRDREGSIIDIPESINGRQVTMRGLELPDGLLLAYATDRAAFGAIISERARSRSRQFAVVPLDSFECVEVVGANYRLRARPSFLPEASRPDCTAF